MAIVALTKGKTAIVCDCHYDVIKDVKWCFAPAGYAARRVGGRKASLTYMHRVIGNGIKGMEVDHINGDKLDNRCTNLRVVTRRENTLNRGLISTNKSGYKGVSWNKIKNRWQVQLSDHGRRVYAAYFKDVKEAAKAYNVAALEYHGEFAQINKGVI